MNQNEKLSNLSIHQLDQLAYIKSNRKKALIDDDKYISSFNSKFTDRSEIDKNQAIEDIIESLTTYPQNEFLWSQLIDLHIDNLSEAFNISIKALNHNKQSTLLWLKAIKLAPESKAAAVCQEALKALPSNPTVQLSIINKAPSKHRLDIALKSWSRVKHDDLALVIIKLLLDDLAENPLLKAEIIDIFEQSNKSTPILISVMPFIDISSYETPLLRLLSAEFSGDFDKLPELFKEIQDFETSDLKDFPYSKRLLERTPLTPSDLINYPKMPTDLFPDFEWRYFFKINKSPHESHWTSLLKLLKSPNPQKIDCDADLKDLVLTCRGFQESTNQRTLMYLNKLSEEDLIKVVRSSGSYKDLAWFKLIEYNRLKDFAKSASIAQRYLSFDPYEPYLSILSTLGLLERHVTLPSFCGDDLSLVLEKFWNESTDSLLWNISLINISELIKMTDNELLNWLNLDLTKIRHVFK